MAAAKQFAGVSQGSERARCGQQPTAAGAQLPSSSSKEIL